MSKRRKSGLPVSKILRYSIFALFAAYAAVTFITQQGRFQNYASLRSEYDKQILQQRQLADQIEKDKQNQSTDAFKEKMARDKLGFVKDNERIFIDGSGR